MARDFLSQRQQLVSSLQHAGVHDRAVLAAIMQVPRELFIDRSLINLAYSDQALPIAQGQTISQPLIVATMTQALHLSGEERVLEIGTGSGYQAAILAILSAHVYSIERYAALAYLAAFRLTHMQLRNISIYIGDGSRGWAEQAPYDRIIVTAAAPRVPPQLLEQLEIGGILAIPVGQYDKQDLCVVRRLAEGVQIESLGGCMFVPLIGEEGWNL